MASGQRRWSWSLGIALPLLGAMVGCATDHQALDKALLANRDSAANGANPHGRYVVHCPDVLDVTINGHP